MRYSEKLNQLLESGVFKNEDKSEFELAFLEGVKWLRYELHANHLSQSSEPSSCYWERHLMLVYLDALLELPIRSGMI